MLPRFKPRHTARGMITITSPSNTGVAYLFNNSTGRDILVVRDIRCGTAAPSLGLCPIGAIQQTPGTAGGVVDSIVTGEAAPPGVLYTQDVASPPAGSFFVVDVNFGPSPTISPFPLMLLLPGWTAFVVAGTASQSLTAAFYWQRVNADDIDGSLVDLALNLAGA